MLSHHLPRPLFSLCIFLLVILFFRFAYAIAEQIESVSGFLCPITYTFFWFFLIHFILLHYYLLFLYFSECHFFLLFVNPCSDKRPLTLNFKQYLYQCLRSATHCRCLLCIHFSITGFHDLIHDPARTSDRNPQTLRQLMCIENITFSYICNGNDLQN